MSTTRISKVCLNWFITFRFQTMNEFPGTVGMLCRLVFVVAQVISYSGLISYLTAGEPEVRAWTITEGTKAPQAAGKIHTDFERGFIRAEVVTYDDLVKLGSVAAAKEAGVYRSEGKDYVMKDGDVVLFRFNV